MPRIYNYQTDLDQDPYTYTNSCYHCGTENIIKIDEEDYKLWKVDQTYVQNVFPNLSFEEREVLISGTHPQCWTEIFGNEQEEDPYLLEILDAKNDHKQA
jgi:hypothetical protein